MTLDFSAFDITAEEFHRRQKQARARGAVHWLWPEVPVEDWREALRNVELTLREVMTKGEASKPLEGKTIALGLAGYTSGTGPLLGYWVVQGKIRTSPEIAAILDLQLQHNRIRMERMTRRASEIVHALSAERVSVTVLKGMHTAHAYFPDPATRPAADIDLLVDNENGEAFSRANNFFEREGFVLRFQNSHEYSWRPPSSATEPHSLMLVHADDPWTIDLHNSLNYEFARNLPAPRLDELTAGAPAGQWPVDPAAKVLQQPLLLLHLATHASFNFVNLTLLRLIELALVIRKDAAAGDLRWDEFLTLGRRVRALGAVYPALHLCEALTPGTIPAIVRAECRLATPPDVRKLVDCLTPSTAQRLEHMSISEYFMWSHGWRAKMQQVVHQLIPSRSLSYLTASYTLRANVLRRSFGRAVREAIHPFASLR